MANPHAQDFPAETQTVQHGWNHEPPGSGHPPWITSHQGQGIHQTPVNHQPPGPGYRHPPFPNAGYQPPHGGWHGPPPPHVAHGGPRAFPSYMCGGPMQWPQPYPPPPYPYGCPPPTHQPVLQSPPPPYPGSDSLAKQQPCLPQSQQPPPPPDPDVNSLAPPQPSAQNLHSQPPPKLPQPSSAGAAQPPPKPAADHSALPSLPQNGAQGAGVNTQANSAQPSQPQEPGAAGAASERMHSVTAQDCVSAGGGEHGAKSATNRTREEKPGKNEEERARIVKDHGEQRKGGETKQSDKAPERQERPERKTSRSRSPDSRRPLSARETGRVKDDRYLGWRRIRSRTACTRKSEREALEREPERNRGLKEAELRERERGRDRVAAAPSLTLIERRQTRAITARDADAKRVDAHRSRSPRWSRSPQPRRNRERRGSREREGRGSRERDAADRRRADRSSAWALREREAGWWESDRRASPPRPTRRQVSPVETQGKLHVDGSKHEQKANVGKETMASAGPARRAQCGKFSQGKCAVAGKKIDHKYACPSCGTGFSKWQKYLAHATEDGMTGRAGGDDRCGAAPGRASQASGARPSQSADKRTEVKGTECSDGGAGVTGGPAATGTGTRAVAENGSTPGGGIAVPSYYSTLGGAMAVPHHPPPALPGSKGWQAGASIHTPTHLSDHTHNKQSGPAQPPVAAAVGKNAEQVGVATGQDKSTLSDLRALISFRMKSKPLQVEPTKGAAVTAGGAGGEAGVGGAEEHVHKADGPADVQGGAGFADGWDVASTGIAVAGDGGGGQREGAAAGDGGGGQREGGAVQASGEEVQRKLREQALKSMLLRKQQEQQHNKQHPPPQPPPPKDQHAHTPQLNLQPTPQPGHQPLVSSLASSPVQHEGPQREGGVTHEAAHPLSQERAVASASVARETERDWKGLAQELARKTEEELGEMQVADVERFHAHLRAQLRSLRRLQLNNQEVAKELAEEEQQLLQLLHDKNKELATVRNLVTQQRILLVYRA